MMSMIGWATLIYIFVGCVLTIAFYAWLSYEDEFEYFMEDTLDRFHKYTGHKINMTMESYTALVTVTMIFNWLLYVIMLIYSSIKDSKESEA